MVPYLTTNKPNMQTLQDLIQRLSDIQTLRGPDCKVIVKVDARELEIDGIRADTTKGYSEVIITVQ